jgi:integrase
MQAKITQTLVQNIKPQEKIFRVNDTLLKGFTLLVRPSGKKTWVVDYKRPDGSRTDHRIGPATLFTVADAREQAREFLAAVTRGEDPTAPSGVLTLGDFIRDVYSPWVTENRKTGRETILIIQRSFDSLLNVNLDEISIALLEQWRTQQRRKGKKASSLNREATALKAAINWAVQMDVIKENPIAKFKPLPERDSKKIVRYLSGDERTRLMAALDERENRMRQGRESHNEWLDSRGLEERPQFEYFVDHLKPMILLSLSTGIRQDALFSLEWRDVNFSERTLVLRPEVDKTSKLNYMPMNDTAYDLLLRWRDQSEKTTPDALVFPSPKTGKKMDNCKSAWAALLKSAEIKSFRWHDMRHDFASQLVMSGVDLNTVRELLGHADLKMTLRYAHLAPENKMQAVKVLDRKNTMNDPPVRPGGDVPDQAAS